MTAIRVDRTRRAAPKKRRRQQPLTKWLRDRTSPIDFGIKTRGDDPHPIHVNSKNAILSAFNGGRWLKRMKNADFEDHFAGRETYYFTGNGRSRSPEMLVNIDIDCHKAGTLEGAKAFAAWLREHHYPNLYYEVSTNGNGVHGYVVLSKCGFIDNSVNELLGRLQQHLRALLRSQSFDVEGVEIKGMCSEVEWGDKRGEVRTFKCGSLAKLPRESERFDELKNTTRLSAQDLMRLPPVHKQKQNGGRSLPGSVTGCVISPEEQQNCKTAYLELAHLLMNRRALPTTSRTVVTAEDLAIFMMLLKFFTSSMNPDGSLPHKRFRSLWKAVYQAGDVDRDFQDNRFAVCRTYLSSLGLIDWEDSTYVVGALGKDGRRHGGQACKWQASESLLSLMKSMERAEEIRIHEDSLVTGPVISRGEEEASLALAEILLLIENLTPTPYWQTTRPQQITEPPPLMLNPDEIMKHLPNIETMWTVAI